MCGAGSYFISIVSGLNYNWYKLGINYINILVINPSIFFFLSSFIGGCLRIRGFSLLAGILWLKQLLIYPLSYKCYSIPTTLWTGFIVIHPLLLYCSVALGIYYLYYLRSYRVLSLMRIVKLSSYALLFGVYWGFYTNIWGFFWVNDFVEWVLLQFVIYFVILAHHFKLVYCINVSLLTYSIILSEFLIVRYKFIWTRHSFFSKLTAVQFLGNISGVVWSLSFFSIRLSHLALYYSLRFYNGSLRCLGYYISWYSILTNLTALTILRRIRLLIFHSILGMLLISWSYRSTFFFTTYTISRSCSYTISYYYLNSVKTGGLYRWANSYFKSLKKIIMWKIILFGDFYSVYSYKIFQLMVTSGFLFFIWGLILFLL